MGILYGAPIPMACPDGTKAFFQAWRMVLRRTGWNQKLTCETPLWQGTWLQQTATLGGFHQWDLIGVSTLGDLWGTDQLKFHLRVTGGLRAL